MVMHSVHGFGSRLSISVYSCIRRIVVYDASVRANCSESTLHQHCHLKSSTHTPIGIEGLSCLSKGRRQRPEVYLRPIQIRGPPLKGRYSHPGLNFSQRSGLKSSASFPKRSSRRCMANKFQPTVVFAGMKRGDLPSVPPPRGSTVSVIDMRELTGTTGYRQSAVKACQRPVVMHQVSHTWRRFASIMQDEIRTLVHDIFEILHILDLFVCRLLSIQCIYLAPQFRPDIRSFCQDEPHVSEKAGGCIATSMIQVSTPQGSVSKAAPKLPMPHPNSSLDNVTRTKDLGSKDYTHCLPASKQNI